MNAIAAWFNSHNPSAHFTSASIVATFGTVYGFYVTVPQFATFCQQAYAALPGWLETAVSAAVGILLLYWRTSAPPATKP